MFQDSRGPIQKFSWGSFIIKGKEHAATTNHDSGAGKDIRLIGNHVTKWKERKGHILYKEMITKVFNKGINTLIIGTGVDGMIECADELVAFIKNKGIPNVIVEKTPEACKSYNNLYNDGVKVALLAHGTC